MLDTTTEAPEGVMTQTAQRDFAPILARFPQSHLDDEGHPQIRHYDADVECDPFWISFAADGTLKFETESFPYLMFCPVALDRIANLGREAKALYDDWHASESGQAWFMRGDLD